MTDARARQSDIGSTLPAGFMSLPSSKNAKYPGRVPRNVKRAEARERGAFMRRRPLRKDSPDNRDGGSRSPHEGGMTGDGR